MTPEPSDHTQAGQVFQKAMEEAMAHLDEVNENLRKAQEEAVDLQIKARDEISRIEHEAYIISRDYMDEHQLEIRNDIRNQLLRDIVKKLILAEIPSDKLAVWLEISPEILAKVWGDIGFEIIDERFIGHVAYQGLGRVGTIIFYRNDRTLHFEYEYAAGDALATIRIPTAENWEQVTKLPLDQRDGVLQFIAKRVLRGQSPKGHFVIGPDEIVIMK